MLEEILPTVRVTEEAAAELPPDLCHAADAHPAPSAEEVRAADALFARPTEADHVANLVGLWTSVMVLRDLAVDAVAGPEAGHLARPAAPQDPRKKGDRPA